MHAQYLGGRGRWISEFKASLVYKEFQDNQDYYTEKAYLEKPNYIYITFKAFKFSDDSGSSPLKRSVCHCSQWGPWGTQLSRMYQKQVLRHTPKLQNLTERAGSDHLSFRNSSM